MHDLILKNGVIVDGTGRDRFRGDVAVRDGVIVEVGEVSGPAKRTLDAEGAIVTPGFVDIHTHYDGQVSWDSVLAPSSINGVTSTAMGNCGVGFAPARVEKHDWLINLLEGVEDIPGTALAEGLTWDWESFPDYLNALAKRRYTMDIGAHVPHAALRAFVMGDAGGDHTAVPSQGEIERMEQLTFEALEAGALGFSTSRTYVHRSRDGANIGTLTASAAELLGVTSALKRAGKGVVQLISDAYLTADDDFAQAELDLIRQVARSTGRKLSFTVQQTDDAPDRWRHIFGEIEAMTAEGLDVRAQVAPRPIGVILTFASTTNPFFIAPTYRDVARDSTTEQRLARLADPEIKAKILAEHAHIHPPGMAAVIVHGFNRMFRMSDPVDYEPVESASLGAEAARAGRDPADYVYDVLLEEGGRRLIYMPLINYARGNLDDVYGMMSGAHTLYGLSDGGAHCGTICDGSFPTTTIGLWSKGSKSGFKTPLETLVHGYTQRNAAHVGWDDRGVIKPGYLADLNVISLDDLQLSPPQIVQDLPAGGTRLLQTARGYRWTVKSGAVTFENGQWTGETPGQLLRGAQAL
ncbi:N-acyl-D-amino-acid deacylase family protein [Phenylobacterium aquaticum]|uniref:N-acyl-D-amino-acid deacylase family protein n=1 Tax=Phenylobacterium aquaticum TaxID=1763816 RepID=UPI001F5CCC91|nr:amidohydrolase family protein [Phenylobacterium aquaticum]MCI3131926.1 amidohydrolase family protein [Phenylobacterium aquaticum]